MFGSSLVSLLRGAKHPCNERSVQVRGEYSSSSRLRMTEASAALDLPALLEETGALLSGHFRLSSGLHSPNYVQCAKLLEHPRHARAIGEDLAAKLRALNAEKIVAPALGGVIIGYTVAEALDVPSI